MLELFSNNLINWLLLVVLLIYMWMKITPAIFASRKDKIETAIKEAEQAKLEAENFRKEQESRVANAEAEASKILDEAKKVAGDMAADIKKQTELETAALAKRIDEQIKAEERMAITEMRSRAATVAVRLAEASLPGAITSSAKSRLLNQFVEQLEGGNVKSNGANGAS